MIDILRFNYKNITQDIKKLCNEILDFNNCLVVQLGNVKKDKIISLGSSESNVNANNNDRKLEAEHAFGWYETMVNDLFI